MNSTLDQADRLKIVNLTQAVGGVVRQDDGFVLRLLLLMRMHGVLQRRPVYVIAHVLVAAAQQQRSGGCDGRRRLHRRSNQGLIALGFDISAGGMGDEEEGVSKLIHQFIVCY